jgi:hypothetical protein
MASLVAGTRRGRIGVVLDEAFDNGGACMIVNMLRTNSARVATIEEVKMYRRYNEYCELNSVAVSK